jgi:uncharacterized membrane protein YeaQ/YmgE (transglycosylase-associated protein family)
MFSLIGSIILGGIAGLIAGNIRKGGGYGLIWNVVVGIIGGGIGSYIFSLLGLNPSDSNILGNLLVSVVGALILLFILNSLGNESA